MAVMTPGAIAAVIAKAGHAVDVRRPIQSEDAVGGRDRVWFLFAGDLPCWVQPASASTMEWYGERGITVTHRVYFPSDPGVQIGDRLKF